MRVLSLFDGMACGYTALERAGITIDKYYASEIDKYAMQIALKNHPDIIEIGDVCNVKGEDYKGIDLLIGGSPCQGFSIAGKMLNFNDSRSKLFFEYVRILKECQPKYFLLENVKMKKEFQDVITEQLGVKPIEINSSLVSAQNRKRLYWTNIPGITQPEDKGILLKDILEENIDPKYELTESNLKTYSREFGSKGKIIDGDKCPTLTASMGTGGGNVPALIEFVGGGILKIRQATKQGYIVAEQGDGISLAYPNSTTRRGRVQKGKSNTLVCQGDSYVYDKVIRKLTPTECERLQTLPDGYTEGVSDTQRYKMLGNGWTVDVIAHIFRFIDH